MKKKIIAGGLVLLAACFIWYLFGGKGDLRQMYEETAKEEKVLSLEKEKEKFLNAHKKVLDAEETGKLKAVLEEQIAKLQEAGWSSKAVAGGYVHQLDMKKDLKTAQEQLETMFADSQVFGSRVFQELWQKEAKGIKKERARQLLTYSLQLVGVPEELSGEEEETRRLVGKFSDELQPDDYFWGSFARTVQKAFPRQELSRKDPLAKQIHQFRYVISAQQAQWVRENFREEGQTDKDALVAYLAAKRKVKEAVDQFGLEEFRYFVEYDLEESSRLHNKVATLRGQSGSVVIRYPNYDTLVNIKIVMNFHTEFILSSEGRFVNELDPEGTDANGIINGASFNYANKNNKLHRTLDITPVRAHDPAYRKVVTRTADYVYQAPNNIRTELVQVGTGDWSESYFNKKGLYSYQKKSCSQSVRKEIKRLKKAVKEAADE